jgi:hypothetical protein
MSNETACCHAASSKPFVSSITYTHTVIKTQVRYADIQNQMLSVDDDSNMRDQKAHEASVHQQIMASLPDIRDLLKPWYFRRASAHNFDVIRQASFEYVNKPETEMTYEVAFKQIRYVNGLWEGKPVCGCQSVDKGHATSSEGNLEAVLTEDDQTKLESLHHEASDSGEDTTVVDSLATQVASDRIFERRNTQPILDRQYLETFVNKAVDLKERLESTGLLDRMKSLLA